MARTDILTQVQLAANVSSISEPDIVKIVKGRELWLNTGYGGSYENNATSTYGVCVKFVFNASGNSKATYGGGGEIEKLLEGKAGQYICRVRLKSNMPSSVGNFGVAVQNPVSQIVFPKIKGSTEAAEAILTANELGPDWTWVNMPFYWDGIQPIELWTGKMPGGTPGVIFWEDYVMFTSNKSRVPLLISSPGGKGDMCWDDNYLYICVSDNNWKRTTLASW